MAPKSLGAKLAEKLRIYVILPESRNLGKMAESALKGGATAVQLRMKNIPDRKYLETALKIRKITENYDALFIVDDRVDIAMASNADGVHVGSEDIPAKYIRNIANDLIIGVTVRDEKMAVSAKKEGASYLGAGSVFESPSKRAPVIGVDKLKSIVESVDIPVIAIGGINTKNVALVMRAGVAGIAVMSAVFAAPSIEHAVRELGDIALHSLAQQGT